MGLKVFRHGSILAAALAHAALFFSTLGLTPLFGQVPLPIGVEFQVNSYTTGGQTNPDIDLDADGDFVVVWDSANDLAARRFSSTGTPLALEFRVNSYTVDFQGTGSVAMSAAGAFVVSWHSYNQDGDGVGIFARRFDAAGAPLDVEFRVNSYTAGSQAAVEVAADADGDFVAVWVGAGTGDTYGIFGRRFTSAGVAVATEFRANATTVGTQRIPSVGMDTDGDFVVAWSSPDSSMDGVFGQRFTSSGSPTGPEFQINSHATQTQYFPSVAVDADGDFVVAWMSFQDPDASFGVFARRFDSAGTPTGSEFEVNLYRTGSQSLPTAAIDRDGDFVIAWYSPDGSSYGLYARRFKSPAVPSTVDFQLNTYTTSSQTIPVIAADDNGNFVVAWRSFNQDGSDAGVFARRFKVPMLIDIDGNGVYEPLKDGLLLLRFGFGFTGATLIDDAVSPDCTRCDATSITIYLQSLV